MAHSFKVFSLFAALAVTNASPLTLSPRGNSPHTIVNYREDLGETFTDFAPNWPTCGNDYTLTDTGISTTITVNTRPDCDAVIDILCQAADRQAKYQATIPNEDKFLYQLGHSNGTCEGHILFPQTSLADPFDYNTCVTSFQSITNTCMLMGDPNVPHNYAAVGKQFGVQNIHHNPGGNTPTMGTWSASTVWNLMPGYMMGAKGVFGDVVENDATDVQADGTVKSSNG